MSIYNARLRMMGMMIDKTAHISISARLDKTYPIGVHIDAYSFVAANAIVFTHDFCRRMHVNTYIGKKCFIGANAIIMCGVRIGDEVIVGAGSIVTKDVPSNCIVAGNPARVIRTGIHTKIYGQLIDGDMSESK